MEVLSFTEGRRRFGSDVLPDRTTVGELDQRREGERPRFFPVARLVEWHHEAAGWADSVGEGAVVIRPADWQGECRCARCLKGWTRTEGNVMDRELPGDREAIS